MDGKRKEGPSLVGLSLPSDLLRPKDFEPSEEFAGAQTNGTLQFTFNLIIEIFIIFVSVNVEHDPDYCLAFYPQLL